ncbi:HAD superfamily hydrolase [Neobacillus bataviensis LMG 21833]|uniref:HAD superfamily hydrolase n=1 Tax=Neobacillus bataviensis LMG 21833 TaxID=1117379 RepID=K6C4T0_9BACI|nr:HAD family hydrolase [Neobacillus bataviensis]EKN66125.1 HAD superfamily hydrolase [Neobacillus bataviensis LMG 21833]
MTIKAVIFDFDGTIIDTETIWFHVFQELLEEKFKLDLPLEEFAKSIGTTDDEFFQYIESQIGMKINLNEINTLAKERFLEKKGILEVREGVKEKLDEAKGLGYKIGLASSSSREWVEGFLKQFDLWEYFSVIKTSEDVDKVKPDPELYLKALEELRVEPQEALAIEDSLNGALAAIEAGMTCIVIPNQVTAFLNFHEKAIRSETFADFSFEQIKL